MELKGIKAIVTGGGSGYGKGIAEALSAAGAKVWITGRNSEKLAAAAREIGVQAPPRIRTWRKDASPRANLARWWRTSSPSPTTWRCRNWWCSR